MASDGRLVWNHSTPGRIKKTRSHIPKIKLKISVPIRGGYKAIARHGKTVQEVFIVTELKQSQLETAIADIMN